MALAIFGGREVFEGLSIKRRLFHFIQLHIQLLTQQTTLPDWRAQPLLYIKVPLPLFPPPIPQLKTSQNPS